MRRLHRAHGRQRGEVLLDAGRAGAMAPRSRRSKGCRRRWRPACDAGRVPRGARPAMRLLHAGHGDVGGDAAADKPTPPSRDARLEGNICRCTGYHNIVKAVETAAEAMKPTQGRRRRPGGRLRFRQRRSWVKRRETIFHLSRWNSTDQIVLPDEVHRYSALLIRACGSNRSTFRRRSWPRGRG